MNILVTGASGFVGTHLTRYLAEQGEQVTGVGHHDTHPDLKHYYQLDLLSADATRNFDFTRYDAVIHLAGLAAVGPSFADPVRYIRDNSAMQANLFEACIAQEVKPRMLVVSSGSVYRPEPLPISEVNPVDPSNPYVVSKLAQENLAQYYQHRGFDCIIARPFNHIGPGQGAGFIVPDLTTEILAAKAEGGASLTVGNLTTKRDYTDVRDIVRAYHLLLTSSHVEGIYNICSGHSHTGQEICEHIMRAAETSLTLEVDRSRFRPSDIDEIIGSYDKLHRDTGWAPEISLETTIADVVAAA